MKYLVDIHHGLGDVIHLLPTLRGIEESDRNAEITLIVATSAIIEFMQTQSPIYNFVLMKKKNIFKYKLQHLTERFDYGLIAPCIVNTKKARYLLKFLGGKKIIVEHPKQEDKHRVERNINLISQLSIKCRNIYPEIALPIELERKCECWIRGKTNNTKIIGICIGGNYEKHRVKGHLAYFDVKRWPVKYYHRLLELLVDSKFMVLIFGGEKDKLDFWNERVVDYYDGNVIDLIGKLSYLESAALIKQCDLAVGNDTGMIHVAAALDVPTMTIFCSTDPRKIGAYSKKAKYIEEYLDCKYCYLSKKTFECENRICLSQIKPERVYKEIENII